MDYGVTITRGAAPWQIFQQNEQGTAAIRLEGEYRCIQLSAELPLEFTERPATGVRVRARLVWEDSRETVLPWQDCCLEEGGRWHTVLHAVPAGGLYCVETEMYFDGWDGLSCNRGDMVPHLGVGDVFVIAGQSNAAGRARTPIQDAPELGVHLLRASGKWDLAVHPLADATGAVYVGNYANHNPGHSPWLHFAKLLKHALGYPIGLVMCAYGGAPLRWWNPAENGALYRNMMQATESLNAPPRGVLWYQGETECYDTKGVQYLERFGNMVRQMRMDWRRPGLPFITVQLNRFLREHTAEDDRTWGMVREAQRQAARQLAGVYVVPANDLALYDTGHNAAQSDLALGERCAACALAQLYGRPRDWRAPEPVRAVRTAPDIVMVEFAPVHDELEMYELEARRLPFTAEDGEGQAEPVRYKAEGARLTLVFSRPLGERAVLHGAWKMDSGAYVPYDRGRLPMLSFYGFPIEKE